MKKTDKITLGENYKIFKRAVPHHDRLQNTIAREVSISGGKIMIDLGCGLGYTTEAILKVFSPRQLYLVDYDKRMIEIVSQNKKIKKKNINILISNKDAVSFLKTVKSNSIDCVYSCWMIHNLNKPERSKILKEVYRVLKKGGVFVNGDKYAEDNLKSHRMSFNWQEMEYKKAIRKYPKDKAVYQGWISHHRKDDKNKFTEKEQVSLARSLGFKKFNFLNRFHLESVFKAIK